MSRAADQPLPPDGRPGRVQRLVSSHPRTLLLALSILALAWYATTSVVKFNRLRSGMDLTIFDQAIRSFAAGQPGLVPLKSPGMSIFADHFHPIILTMVPLYWIWADPRMLLLAQAVCVALAGWMMGRLAIRRLGPGTGLALALAWFCAFAVQGAVVFDFHEVVLGLPLLALALAAFLDGRWTACWWWSASLMLVKEDTCFLVGGIALAMLVRRHWLRGLGLGIFAVAWTALAVFLVIPNFSPTHAYLYLDSTSAITVAGVQASTHGAWFGPLQTLSTAAVVLAAGAFVAVNSPLIWAFVGPFAVRAVSKNPQHWTLSFHYNILPMLVVCYGFVEAWPRLRQRAAQARGRTGRVLRVWTRCAVPFTLVMALVSLPTGLMVHDWRLGSCGSVCPAFRSATAQIPAGARVAADVYLTSHLTSRAEVFQWRPPDYVDDLGKPVDVDWLVLNRETISYDNEKDHWVDGFLAHPEVRGVQYRQVWAQGPVVVLERVG